MAQDSDDARWVVRWLAEHPEPPPAAPVGGDAAEQSVVARGPPRLVKPGYAPPQSWQRIHAPLLCSNVEALVVGSQLVQGDYDVDDGTRRVVEPSRIRHDVLLLVVTM